MPLKVIVIGGVAAGPKTAAKIMRLNPAAEVTLLERQGHYHVLQGVPPGLRSGQDPARRWLFTRPRHGRRCRRVAVRETPWASLNLYPHQVPDRLI